MRCKWRRGPTIMTVSTDIRVWSSRDSLAVSHYTKYRRRDSATINWGRLYDFRGIWTSMSVLDLEGLDSSYPIRTSQTNLFGLHFAYSFQASLLHIPTKFSAA